MSFREFMGRYAKPTLGAAVGAVTLAALDPFISQMLDIPYDSMTVAIGAVDGAYSGAVLAANPRCAQREVPRSEPPVYLL